MLAGDFEVSAALGPATFVHSIALHAYIGSRYEIDMETTNGYLVLAARRQWFLGWRDRAPALPGSAAVISPIGDLTRRRLRGVEAWMSTY